MIRTLLCILCILAFLHLFSKSKKELKCSYENAFDTEHVKYYDTLVYDDVKQKRELLFLDSILHRGDSILDVGSGTGHFVNALYEKGIHVTGLDSSTAMISYSKKKYHHDYLLGDASTMSLFSKHTFSHVSCMYYTIYYLNPKLFFQNAYEWLMPGGLCIVHMSDTWKYGPTSTYRGAFTYSSSRVYNRHHEWITLKEKKIRFEHKIKWESISTLELMATKAGFKFHSKYKYPLPYHGEYLYVFQK